MPTTRRQSSRVLRKAALSSRNTPRRGQQQQSDTSPPADSPPANQPSHSTSSSSASHHSLNPASAQASRAASSPAADSSQGHAEEARSAQYYFAYEKLFTFTPHSDLVEERDPNARTRDILERLRYTIFQKVLDIVATEAEKNRQLFERLDSVAPRRLTRIEELRYQALEQLKLFDSAVEADPANAESRAERCATHLQKFAHEINDSGRWIDKTCDSFALGTLVMIVEEVVERGAKPGPQQHIYETLISDPPEDGGELCALSHIQEYTEDIIQEYVDQLAHIIRQLDGMVGRLKPRSLLARELQAIIQPIRVRGEAATASSAQTRQPEPRRGQKRRESGLYEGAPAGSSAQGGRQSSKRPARN